MFSGEQLAVAVVSEDLIDGELMQIELLVAGLALWHTWWVTMHPKWLETRLVPMAVYFLGLVVMVHWLTALSFSFFRCTWSVIRWRLLRCRDAGLTWVSD